MIVKIVDNGGSFNPFNKIYKIDLVSSLEERTIGKLGIHFVKKLSDKYYHRPMMKGNDERK